MTVRWPSLVFWTLVFVVLGVVALAPDWRLSSIFSFSPAVFVFVLVISVVAAWFVGHGKIDLSSWSAEYRDLALIVAVLIMALLGGMHLISGIAKLSPAETSQAACRLATLWALAYCAVGFLTGFLFGIPRVLQGDAAPRGAAAGSAPAPGYAQKVNTNLEQISDWLTKIIVGLGLVELRHVPDHLSKAATWMAQGIVPKDNGTLAQAASFSSSIIIFFSVVGFLAGYLMTRLFLAGAFRRADVGSETKVSGVGKDDAADWLRKFWKTDGNEVDRDHEQKLLKWMEKNGLISPGKQMDIASFILLPNLADERAKAVEDLKNP